MPSLASLTFNTSGLLFYGASDGERVWSTPAGDRVGLCYHPLRPDIGADLRSLEAIRGIFRSKAAAVGGAIIEVDTATLDGCLALRTILKVPQQPQGMAHLGSLLIPFRDFSFVVRVQCHEWGLTGIRDSVILDEALAEGRVTIDRETTEVRGWMQDPYDPALDDGLQYNLSEASGYDSRFPQHPLTRLRSILAHLEQTIHLTGEVRQSPPYVFPP